MSAAAALRQAAVMAGDLALGRYPAFVYGLRSGTRALPPVFCFHGVSVPQLEPILRFLAEQRYETLDTGAYLDLLHGGRIADPDRSVMLTFDDGLGSLWSLGLDLLARYDARAVVFLIPARIRDRPRPGPRLEDVDAGRALPAEVEGRDSSEEPLATWQEIAAMHASGRFDFQSHGLDHRSIFTASRLQGFVDPALLRHVQRNDLTFDDYEPAYDRAYETPPLGTPLYPRAPRLSDARRLFPDEAVRRACVDHVAARGGAAFFERTDWRAELCGVYRASRSDGAAERLEDASEQAAALRHDLATARTLIETHLPGKSVRSLALPWGRGGALSIEAAKATGYHAVYWGRGRGALRNVIGGDPYRLSRLGEDFARLLGTAGLRRLPALLRDKLYRNLAGGQRGVAD